LAETATANFFDVAQLHMTLGRGFIPGEERLPVIVLGYSLWPRRFGADPNIAGKAVTLSGRPFQVVGVAPPLFHSLDQILNTQFRVPLDSTEQLLPHTSNFASRNYNWLAVTGRLRLGVTPEQAAAELNVIAISACRAYSNRRMFLK